METFGNWGREAQCVFSRLATLLALRQGRPKSSVVRDIYGCLSISLVRSVAGPLWEERQLIKTFVGRLGVLAFSKLAFVNIMYIISCIQ